MSYSNNWLQTISEAYKSKTKKKEKAYVEEDTETLLTIIEVLCEELDIDAEGLLLEAFEQLDEMAQTPQRRAESEKKLAQLERDQARAEKTALSNRILLGPRRDREAAEKRYYEISDRLSAHQTKSRGEVNDPDNLYGKGGKIVATRSKKWIPVKPVEKNRNSTKGHKRNK